MLIYFLSTFVYIESDHVRMSQTKRALDKPVDGELGCVTPFIICPGGPWTQADLDFQAAQVQIYVSSSNTLLVL